MAQLYLHRDMWDKIPEGKEKSADFYIEFEDVIFLFELKSGTMGIGAKQQVPEVDLIEKFYSRNIATVYKGNIIKNLIMDCQSYTKYRPNETTGGIFVSWRRKEELPTGA